jgi:hypothetical protein
MKQALVLALLVAASASAEPPCECGPFDKPDRVVRQGRIELTEQRSIVGAEIYLANTDLSVAGEGVPVVLMPGTSGKEGGRLRLQARREIVLGAGFHARRGSRLEASLVALVTADGGPSQWPADVREEHSTAPAEHRPIAAPDPYRIAPMSAPRVSARKR